MAAVVGTRISNVNSLERAYTVYDTHACGGTILGVEDVLDVQAIRAFSGDWA